MVYGENGVREKRHGRMGHAPYAMARRAITPAVASSPGGEGRHTLPRHYQLLRHNTSSRRHGAIRCRPLSLRPANKNGRHGRIITITACRPRIFVFIDTIMIEPTGDIDIITLSATPRHQSLFIEVAQTSATAHTLLAEHNNE